MIVFIGSIAILTLMFAGTFWELPFISEGILGITAIVILWYTWETSQIRKAEREIAEVSKASLLKSYRPAVGHSIFTNEKTPYDTRVGLVNLSDIGVAVKLRCNLKVDGEPIVDFAPAYEGTEFWNLQYKEAKEGHFNWLSLYLSKNLISKEAMNEIKEAGGPEEISSKIHEYLAFKFNMSEPPKISMDIEIYCCNDKNQTAYYPPTHYSFDAYRMIWIPTITNEKPYWDYEDKPDWINPMPSKSLGKANPALSAERIKPRPLKSSLDAVPQKTMKPIQTAFAVIDILGFGNLMKHHPAQVFPIIFELLRTSERNWLVQRDLDRFTKFSGSDVSPQIQYLQYSDTLLIWRKFENGAPDLLNTAEAMVDTVTYATSMTLGTFLGAGLPLRGAIGFGHTFINADPLFFTGFELYQTMKLETQQEWAGVCIHDSAKPHVDMNGPYVVEAAIPLKNDDSVNGLAVNWVGPLKTMNITPPWQSMFVSEDPSTILKSRNTRNFYDDQLSSNWGLPSMAESTIDALREKVLGLSSQPHGPR